MTYEFHPLANIFPLIEGQAFADLVEDVRANGVREPIWMYQHQILDGRNRYRAANEAGIKCELRTYEGDDAVGFVVSLNLHRRHLTESQRAMVAAKLANMPTHRPSDKSANLQTSQSEAAKMLNVSTRSVAAASKVKDDAIPEIAQAVERGEVSVSAAAAVASMPHDQQAAIAQGGKKAIQRAAKTVRAKPQEAVAPAGTEHVLHIINQMDLISRYLERNGMTPESMASRFLGEIDVNSDVISERLSVAMPIMTQLGSIAESLAHAEVA